MNIIQTDEEKLMQEVERIHGSCPVVDAHLDLAAEIYYRYNRGEQAVIRNHYLESWKKTGIRLIVSSVFVETEDLPGRGLELSVDQIAALHEDLETVRGEVCLIRTAEDLRRTLKDGQIGIILYMEGLDVITAGTSRLRSFSEMGVRGASLTWSRRNMLGEGCALASRIENIRGGLSELGKKTIQKMEELNWFLDVSHLNDDGLKDVIQLAKRPFLATHSNARAVQYNFRNLDDEAIRAIADCGGVIGINAYWNIVGALPGPEGVRKMCDHIQYIAGLVGMEHVGIGLDLCDAFYEAEKGFSDGEEGDCLRSHEEIKLITAELLRRGVEEDQIRRFLGENFIQYFCALLPS